jgi:1,4-alpha-glucan branching enzyme
MARKMEIAMLTKRKLGKGKVRVTFIMPAMDGVNQLNLVGDFNNWSIAENPMERAADGTWSTALTLDGAKDYGYRYLANGVEWHNDWSADSYAPNEYGSDNGVVSLKDDGQPKPATKRASSKKKL